MKVLPVIIITLAGGIAANILILAHAYEAAGVAGGIAGFSAFWIALIYCTSE